MLKLLLVVASVLAAVSAAILASGPSPEIVAPPAQARIPQIATTAPQSPPAALDADPAPTPAPEAPGATEPPPENPVLTLQRSLLAAGFDPGPLDGIYGPRTQAAECRRDGNCPAPARFPTGGYGHPSDAHWDAIQQCEQPVPGTPGWATVSSTYSGGVGFANSTWVAFGGLEFATFAGYATREQQIVIANRVYEAYGPGAWGCKSDIP